MGVCTVKKWMLLAFACCLLADVTGFAANAPADDDEYEEVVVRRKKKKSKGQSNKQHLAVVAPAEAPVVAPVAVAPAAAVVVPAVVTVPVATPAVPVVPVAKTDNEPPPPPEPPAADAAEPRRLVRYFCKAWKDEDWERLWWAMTPKFRKKVSLNEFKTRFIDDAELNGGLKDENIVEVSKTNSGVAVKVELLFKFENAKPRVVNAVVERIVGGQYRVTDSAILPVDLNDL